MTTPAKTLLARPAPRPGRRSILVTGASGGIGGATAARLAPGRPHRVAGARRAGELQALAAEHPGISPVVLDITGPACIDRARHQITTQTGGYGLDVLVNAAGILVLGPVEAVSQQPTRAQLEVNLLGTLAVTRAFLPQMRQRRSGRIVNVSSILGRFALPGSGIYAASKFALEAASDALQVELAPFGVRVVLVEPGVIDTPLHQRAAAGLPDDPPALRAYRGVWPAGFGFPTRLLQTAAPVEGIAATLATAALARRPRARYRRGLRNRLNTWLLTTLPTRASDRIKRRIAGVAASAPPAAPSPGGAAPQQPRRHPNHQGADAKGYASEPPR
jgi:NAD(P)-dependent dehydrogenase (short-subunit alcohol dehydrogenase family)